jgi:hypothetical protein
MRILRHLSFSNVIALLALFVALGGAAYAGTKINGKIIVNGSIGGGKLKNETITANKIKKGTLTGAQIRNETITGAQIQAGSIDARQINLSSLGTVPSAQSANTAGTAAKADSATTADTATSATNAANADSAKHAESADRAATADNATNADTATSADHATNADNATRADTAGDADTLNGATAADLTLSCQSATEFYGGMCWDETTRPAKFWLVAVKECGEEGGRLPTIGELIAFVLRDGEQVEEQVWSGDLADVIGPAESVLTSDENGRGKHEGIGSPLGYRCVFPRSN